MVQIRRVVTGLDAEGRSCPIIDAPFAGSGVGATIMWRSDEMPADNSSNIDTGGGYAADVLRSAGSNLMLVEYQPGMRARYHATDTLDYMIVLRGPITLELDTGDVVLESGDVLINRGIMHGWRNDGPETTLAVVVLSPSLPVGEGATI